jgi:hypothetical protein
MPDCNSHGCVFATALTGMRTNGKCRCIDWDAMAPADRVALRAERLRLRQAASAAEKRAADAEAEAKKYREALQHIEFQDHEDGEPAPPGYLINHCDAGTLAGALQHCCETARKALKP